MWPAEWPKESTAVTPVTISSPGFTKRALSSSGRQTSWNIFSVGGRNDGMFSPFFQKSKSVRPNTTSAFGKVSLPALVVMLPIWSGWLCVTTT